MSIALYLEPILDPITKEYREILTVSALPEGPMRGFVKQKRLPEVSSFKKTNTSTCKYVLMHSEMEYMENKDIPFLFSYLQSKGYTIDTKLTKLYKTPYLICLFSYPIGMPS